MVKGEVKVAYQGMPGAYSEKATRQLLGSSTNVVAVGYPSFEEAFLAVEREEADFGMLPIENSLGGSIHANYDLLLKFGLHIVGEYDLRVEHSLLALPGVKKSDIKTVISHPQALAQCAHTIASMGAKPRAEYDTAGSAKMLADNQWKDTAAVASDLAAEYYGLQVLQRNVEDDAGNFTRFLLLSKKGLDAKADTEFKTSLVFSFMNSNEKGQLYKALSAFSLRDIDMSKIESRPWGHTAEQQYQDTVQSEDFSLSAESVRRKYSYLFYVDLIGHQTDENVINALRHLREFCKFVRVLGSYPTKGKLLGEVRKTLEAVGAYQANPVTASPAITSQQPMAERLNIGIYGFGNFGQFLAKTMAKTHEVRATSRTDYSAVATELGCKYYSSTTQLEQFFDGLDVLLLGVSILSFESVLSKIPKQFLEKLVIVDVLSVKTHPKQIMLRDLPQSASILCTHPMFGPESGKYSWRGLPMMHEKVRILSGEHNHVMDNFLRVFETEQCRMLEMTCESHDEYAASSQFLTHLTGRILSVQGVKNTPIDTRGFKNLVRLVEDTCKDSFDLFQGLYKFNPNSEQQIQKFRESLAEVTHKLGNKPVATSTVREEAPMTEKYPQNPLLGKIAASKTVVIHGMAKQLEAEGKQVWSLCVGEPDFAPAERVLQAGMTAMEQGKVKYTDVKGTAELRTLIAQYLETCKGLKYDPLTEILVSNGAKQTVYQALLTITKPGEQVLIPAPYWTKLSENYLIDPVELEKALVANPRIKSMMLCNPSNPAGTVHSPAQLESIAAVLRKPQFRHILVVADEIYEQLVYQDEGEAKREHQSFATLPGMYERTLTVNGFSKSHAMPGLRIGYLAAPKYFVQMCTKLQGQLTSCASSVGQAAAVEAMKFEMECVSQNKERMTETLAIMDGKRKYIVKRLQAIPQLEFAYPTSAFYVFLDLASYFEGKQGVTADKSEVVKDADDFCEYLLRHYYVALVPGSAFGVKNGLRISYASSMETIEHALDGLEQSLSALTFE
ncbi:aspartate aminotransferase, putative [Phytophthora infestans T30-4]|uniref:Aspartate aminotransferase, putative n=1 Tax=Phytophthora infestans (strain T30-4) TaxID=403677 RepID=D0MUV7_PHYIT|nr:aspartate aminotransferase, putative [Phytophthora infestans T30-4]EEY60953.1 aspartate aminotransferase, putative [Phytophthora infestans T30-4]|eukprot:XP_002907870.1 aspartate aminotransferase, putative [Phytophthora infestans T30-4]